MAQIYLGTTQRPHLNSLICLSHIFKCVFSPKRENFGKEYKSWLET